MLLVRYTSRPCPTRPPRLRSRKGAHARNGAMAIGAQGLEKADDLLRLRYSENENFFFFFPKVAKVIAKIDGKSF